MRCKRPKQLSCLICLTPFSCLLWTTAVTRGLKTSIKQQHPLEWRLNSHRSIWEISKTSLNLMVTLIFQRARQKSGKCWSNLDFNFLKHNRKRSSNCKAVSSRRYMMILELRKSGKMKKSEEREIIYIQVLIFKICKILHNDMLKVIGDATIQKLAGILSLEEIEREIWSKLTRFISLTWQLVLIIHRRSKVLAPIILNMKNQSTKCKMMFCNYLVKIELQNLFCLWYLELVFKIAWVNSLKWQLLSSIIRRILSTPCLNKSRKQPWWV